MLGVASRQRFIKMNLKQCTIHLQKFTKSKTVKQSYVFRKIINLDEILSRNVIKWEDLLMFNLCMFTPDKKFLNIFFMGNKAWDISECIYCVKRPYTVITTHCRFQAALCLYGKKSLLLWSNIARQGVTKGEYRLHNTINTLQLNVLSLFLRMPLPLITFQTLLLLNK